MINVRDFSFVISSGVMNIVSVGSGDNLFVPQYHSKMIFTDWYKEKYNHTLKRVLQLVQTN